MRQSPAEVGLVLPNRGVLIGATTVAELLDNARRAEDSGWDSVWVGDSLLAKPRIDAMTVLAAIAAVTSTVRLGVSCMASTPLRDPLLLAYQWASLDYVSGGRTIFVACQGGGPGSGGFENELEAFGIERGTRATRMEEAIEIMRKVWTEDHVNFSGEHRRFRDVTVYPKPVQKHLPIWLVANPDLGKPANVRSSLSRVARLADGWQTTHSHPEEVESMLSHLQAFASEMGRDLGSDFPVSMTLNISVGASRGQALDEAREFLDRHSDTSYTDDFLSKWVAAGTPDDCVEFIRRYRAVGVNHILLRPASFRQAEQIVRVSEEVLPHIR